MGATYDDCCVPNLFRLLYQFDPQEPARKKRRLIIIKYVEDDADIDGAATVAASVDVSERQMVRIGSFLLGLDATVRCALCRDTQLPRTETQCALPNALHLGKSDWHWLPNCCSTLEASHTPSLALAAACHLPAAVDVCSMAFLGPAQFMLLNPKPQPSGPRTPATPEMTRFNCPC